jgi:aminoglycoside phosphotransferase (APT) family kinase protein
VDPGFLDGMVGATEEAVPLARERLSGIAPDWLLKRVDEAPAIVFEQLRALDALPHTLIHLDYRVQNMIFLPEENPDSMTLIDWQFMLRGPGVVDIAVFCMLSLQVDHRRAWENELVLGYLSELEGRAILEWPDSLKEAWRRMALFNAFQMIRNIPVFDLANEDVVQFVRELFTRFEAAVDDHAALDLLDR